MYFLWAQVERVFKEKDCRDRNLGDLEPQYNSCSQLVKSTVFGQDTDSLFPFISPFTR